VTSAPDPSGPVPTSKEAPSNQDTIKDASAESEIPGSVSRLGKFIPNAYKYNQIMFK
jgi:hypothetical protein